LTIQPLNNKIKLHIWPTFSFFPFLLFLSFSIYIFLCVSLLYGTNVSLPLLYVTPPIPVYISAQLGDQLGDVKETNPLFESSRYYQSVTASDLTHTYTFTQILLFVSSHNLSTIELSSTKYHCTYIHLINVCSLYVCSLYICRSI